MKIADKIKKEREQSDPLAYWGIEGRASERSQGWAVGYIEGMKRAEAIARGED